MDFDFDFDFQKKRVLIVIFIVGIIGLGITADKCRQLVGEDYSSQSGKFTIFNCFDMSTGTLACTVKEGVKLYFYNLRTAHVERARNLAIERSLIDAMGQGLSATDAAKQAQKEGAKAAKLAKRQGKRIIGPIISSGWDFFEALYYGGTMTEGFLRGSGTLVGAYAGGYLGEASLGRFGYLVGSHLGSWVGGRIGLMVYDVVNGVEYLLQIYQGGASEVREKFENSEVSEDFNVYETPAYTSSKVSDDSNVYESPADRSSEVPEDTNIYESTTYENSESYENSEFR
ncbi:hypothetical protein JCGZ_23218 [Jatropha curcas]|uniref:Uncharacterized protein n=1 Tax=Jatropha curcas TaxID=180498 RepID=A0A067JTQ9_JATCU|nr:uncharacterized protein LOC105647421 [Jatropha curcas]KDP23385.1 hypothetical protein JCGZ_23218 [Jatropha curcas]